jgi:hypothetical protein
MDARVAGTGAGGVTTVGAAGAEGTAGAGTETAVGAAEATGPITPAAVSCEEEAPSWRSRGYPVAKALNAPEVITTVSVIRDRKEPRRRRVPALNPTSTARTPAPIGTSGEMCASGLRGEAIPTYTDAADRAAASQPSKALDRRRRVCGRYALG